MTHEPVAYESLPKTLRPHRGMFYAGWVLSGLPALFILTTATMTLLKPEMAKEKMGAYGFQPHLITPIVLTEIICVVIYLVPNLAVLGAILLTGYLGGAVVTHVRVGEPPIMPIVFGVVFWLGLYLRDERVRALAPWRRVDQSIHPSDAQ